jgi:hypothetical protein
MGSNRKTFKTVMFEDGTCAVARTDPSQRGILEVVALFYDPALARKYAAMENAQLVELPKAEPSIEPQVKRTATPEYEIKEPNGVRLTGRQSAVLEVLRAKAGDDDLVEMKGGDLAVAANVPLGSVHSVIQSLEKKKFIVTARPGTSHAPAVYQVLPTGLAPANSSPAHLQ